MSERVSECRGRWGETDPVRNFWFYDTINVPQGLSFFSICSPQSHISLGYTILSATLWGEERFLINYFGQINYLAPI